MNDEAERIDVLQTSPVAWSSIYAGIKRAFHERLKPPPKLNLVEWADEYRYLPDNSAESGRWRTSRVEVSRAPMLSVSDPDVQEVTIMSCIQLMKTELMLNAAMYYMHQEPSPIMYVAPKQAMAEGWSKERLVKSVNATPVLANIFSENRRDQGNTITQKQFAGGQISIVSARNPDDLAMRACRIMLFDEVDKYPSNVGAGEGGSGGEGDPIAVAWGRATTYGSRAKKIMACSPTVQNQSRIEEEYFKSDMRVFHQKCVHCDHSKELKWSDVSIPRDDESGNFYPDKAVIVCSECGATWSERDRHWSIRNGEWIAQRPHVKKHHGYKVSALASPFTPIVKLATEFVNALGNPESMKAFKNTRLAETWREKGELPDWKRLYEGRLPYPIKTVPIGALMLTCAVDVQKGYLIYEVVGWGERKQSWTIDAGVINGDISEQDTKDKLADLFDTQYSNHKGVRMPIEMGAVDSGYMTQEVYAFVRWYGSDCVRAIKGQDSQKSIIGAPTPVDVNLAGKRISRGLKLWSVGSSVVKEQVYRWFNIEKPTKEELDRGRLYPVGTCFFPELSEEYFKQLCSEQLTKTKNRQGFEVYTWEKIRPDNHWLDCRVYNRACAEMLQISRMTPEHWQKRREMFGYDIVKDDKVAVESVKSDVVREKPEKAVKKVNKRKKPAKSSFWKGRK